VEACDYSWSPRSNATALAGYAITMTNKNVIIKLLMLQVVQLREPRQLYGMYSGLWGPQQPARWSDCCSFYIK